MVAKYPSVIEDSENCQSSHHEDCDSPPVNHVLIENSSASSMARPVSPLLTLEEEAPADNNNKARDHHVYTSNSYQTKIKLNAQQGFLLFVKIYSLYMDRLPNASLYKKRFKATVSKCTTENRRGNPNYTPLQDVIQRKLRQEFGEIHWYKAMHILRVYCREHGIQSKDDSLWL